MQGDRWHPSHDLEVVTYYFKKKAIEALGKSMFVDIILEMIDDDHPSSLDDPLTNYKPLPKSTAKSRRDQFSKMDHPTLDELAKHNNNGKEIG